MIIERKTSRSLVGCVEAVKAKRVREAIH